VKLFHRKDFLGITARALRAAFVLMLITQFLEFRGLLASPEGAVLDLLLGNKGKPQEPGPVITVEIDDAAYAKCFDATSPLYPHGVFALVRGVHEASPAVVGIDILTDAERYASAYRDLAGKLHEKERTIWISGAGASKFHAVSFPGWLLGHEDHLVIRPSKVLGQEPEEATRGEIQWAVPVFSPDPDMSVRRFPREVQLSADPESEDSPQLKRHSWAAMIAEHYCGGRKDCNRLDPKIHEVFVPYSHGPQRRINVLDLFRCSGKGAISTGGRLWDEFKERVAPGKIVLIGGSFGSARDSYETPIGRIPGLLVNAYTVQAEIDGTGIQEKRLAAVILDLVAGLAMAVIAWVLRKHRMRVMMTASFLLLAGGLLLTYRQFGRGYLLSFSGMVGGLLLHQLYEVWHMNPKAGEEH
jgi:CHASE2 domain-containing sensor protein